MRGESMPCTDPFAVFLAVAKPGDRVQVWIDGCSPAYYLAGNRTITHPAGQSTAPVYESQVSGGARLTYYYHNNEVFTASLFFDPSAAGAGKSCRVHGQVTAPDGTARHREWCTTIAGATADPNVAIFSVKGS
jgi:hypothetical protein